MRAVVVPGQYPQRKARKILYSNVPLGQERRQDGFTGEARKLLTLVFRRLEGTMGPREMQLGFLLAEKRSRRNSKLGSWTSGRRPLVKAQTNQRPGRNERRNFRDGKLSCK